MKKLIGLLGAAGLLIPSAAMAGNIGNQTGSSAMRATGTTSSFSDVSVNSSIDRVNKIHVMGSNHGISIDFSAENATAGHRHGDYKYDQTTGSTATNVDAAAEVGAGGLHRRAGEAYYEKANDSDVTTHTTHLPGDPGKADKCHWLTGCHGGEPATPDVTTVDTQTEGEYAVANGSAHSTLMGHGAYGEAEGYLNGGYDDSNVDFTNGKGGEYFLNGAASGSIDTYTNGYMGSLTETGNTQTSVDAFTSATSTSKGFESSSFTNTDWN